MRRQASALCCAVLAAPATVVVPDAPASAARRTRRSKAPHRAGYAGFIDKAIVEVILRGMKISAGSARLP
jgi:hypothetical protein